MPDRILTATSSDGQFSVAAGVTTELVRESQRRHGLAPTASAAVGRLVTGGVLLGTALKGKERLSLQVASRGPLAGLTADIAFIDPETLGARAYARNPTADVPLNAHGKFDVAAAVGAGHLQVTRSFEVGQPYVGVVPLASGEIGDDIARYLAQSEQIPSVVALGVLANSSGIKAAGGIVAQVLPGADEATVLALEERARAMAPVTSQIDAGASPEDLIAALAGGIAMKPRASYGVRFACRCSRARVETALLALGRDELAKIARDGEPTEAVCEFCKRRYEFSVPEVTALIERLEARG